MSKFDKEPNRGRGTSAVDRHGPIDYSCEQFFRHSRHGGPQLFFGDHEIGETYDDAVDRVGQETHVRCV